MNALALTCVAVAALIVWAGVVAVIVAFFSVATRTMSLTACTDPDLARAA